MASRHSQMMTRLKALLEAIASDGGTTYWYTPQAVIEFPSFTAECLNAGDRDVIYCLSPGKTDIDPFTYTRTLAVAEVRLAMAKRVPTGTENPYSPWPTPRIEEQHRLIEDATAAINSDWDLGANVLRVDIVEEDRSAEETYYDGWAVARLGLRVQYEYDDDEP
jgi:hypothetical protein